MSGHLPKKLKSNTLVSLSLLSKDRFVIMYSPLFSSDCYAPHAPFYKQTSCFPEGRVSLRYQL
jgi:hypothetical protein